MIRAKDGFILQQMMDAYMIIAAGAAGEPFRDILKTNETGAFYFRQLRQGTTVDAMVEESLKRFEDLSPEAARKDVEAFLANISDVIEEV